MDILLTLPLILFFGRGTHFQMGGLVPIQTNKVLCFCKWSRSLYILRGSYHQKNRIDYFPRGKCPIGIRRFLERRHYLGYAIISGICTYYLKKLNLFQNDRVQFIKTKWKRNQILTSPRLFSDMPSGLKRTIHCKKPRIL